MAKTYDLLVEAGATYSISFIYKNKQGVPFDLTGYEVMSQVRNISTDELMFSPSIETDDANGVVILSMSASQTALLVNNPYVYGVELHGDDVIRLVQGKVFVSPEVVK